MFILRIAFTIMGSCLNLLLCSSTHKSEESTLLSYTFYFLMWLIRPFWKQQLVIYVDYCSPSWFFWVCFFSSAALSFPLLPGHWAGWRPIGRSGYADSPVSEMPLTASAITCLSLLEHLWLFCEHKTTRGMPACSLLLPPVVYRYRSQTYTVATALSWSNNFEFGTRIIFCTKASCICAKKLLCSCFLRAQWLSVFNAVLSLCLGC